MQSLRPYQTNALNRARASLSEHRRSILVAPTGAGKTTIAAEIVKRATANGSRILILAHRKELTDQLANRFKQFGVYSGRIQAGKASTIRQATVASQPTLVRRMDKLPHANLVIVDECHHAVSDGYKKLLDHYESQGAYILGLTATPARLDGKPLGDIFSDIVDVIPMQSLIDQGYLVQPRYFAPKDMGANLAGLRTKMGEFANDQLFERYNKTTMYDGVLANFSKFASDRKTIVFCVNVQHAKQTAEAFTAKGIKADYLDGSMPTTKREAILASFADGSIQVLCNVNILTEGYDLPAIECVILNRATQSLTLYMQMIGRGLRPAPNKTDLIVIDHGENLKRHMYAEDEKDWTLEGKITKGDGVAPIKECPSCEALIHSSARVCKHCQHEFEQEQKELAQAEFVEMPRSEKAKWENRPQHLRKPVGAMDENELHAYAKHMGYKAGWVFHQLNSVRTTNYKTVNVRFASK